MPKDAWAKAKRRDRARQALRDGSPKAQPQRKRRRKKSVPYTPRPRVKRPSRFQPTLPVCHICRHDNEVVGIREQQPNGTFLYRAHCERCQEFVRFIGRATYELLEAEYINRQLAEP